jgi:hypothetical protein
VNRPLGRMGTHFTSMVTILYDSAGFCRHWPPPGTLLVP